MAETKGKVTSAEVGAILNLATNEKTHQMLGEISWIVLDWLEADTFLEAMGYPYLGEGGYRIPMSLRIRQLHKERRNDG